MKKLTLVAAVLLTVISTAFASGDGTKSDRTKVVPMANNTFKVFYATVDPTVVKIRLRTEDGKLIRTDRVKSEGGFMKRYDLTALENGKYYFELTDQYGVVSQQVEVSEKPSSTLAVKALKDKKYQLIVDQEGKLPIVLTIYNADDEILHKETYKDISSFSRVYDLSKFDSENFVFQISDENTTRIVSVD